METIALGADHAGFVLKETLKQELIHQGYPILDFGTTSPESVHYPLFAQKVAEALLQNKAQKGILICGSGIGISIAANRFKGIRAALCWNEETARLARAHNNANILVLGSKFISLEIALNCLHLFLTTPFEGGRHQTRLDQIEMIGANQ